MNNILIVAPHCDDEVLGCGAVMARYSAMEASVYVAIVTNGHIGAPELFSKEGTERVRAEALQAHQILGVAKTYFLDFPAPRLDSVPAYKISLAINKIIKNHSIDTMYVPHRGDIHKDHGITYLASLVAARPINGCTVKKILAYETLSETEWAPPFGDDAFIPTEFVGISEFLNKKIAAFSCFGTQKKEFPHPRSLESIENLAKMRGATVGFDRAEAFMIIRNIIE